MTKQLVTKWRNMEINGENYISKPCFSLLSFILAFYCGWMKSTKYNIFIFIYNIIYNIRKVLYNSYENYWRYFAFNRWQQPLVCSFVLALFFPLALELFTCISISIKLKTQNSFSTLVGNQNVLSKNCEMYAGLVRSKSDVLLTFYSSVLKPKPF